MCDHHLASMTQTLWRDLENGGSRHGWVVHRKDWSASIETDQIVEETLQNITPGSIILLHDGGGWMGRESDRSRTIAPSPVRSRRPGS